MKKLLNLVHPHLARAHHICWLNDMHASPLFAQKALLNTCSHPWQHIAAYCWICNLPTNVTVSSPSVAVVPIMHISAIKLVPTTDLEQLLTLLPWVSLAKPLPSVSIGLTKEDSSELCLNHSSGDLVHLIWRPHTAF